MTGPGRLDGRLVALGITGSIAAFKAVDLLRLFRAEGADVVVLMTPSATRFVAPLTLAALSRRPNSSICSTGIEGSAPPYRPSTGYLLSGARSSAVPSPSKLRPNPE